MFVLLITYFIYLFLTIFLFFPNYSGGGGAPPPPPGQFGPTGSRGPPG
jgi:hypothetical protein